jgi:hypothetical protein
MKKEFTVDVCKKKEIGHFAFANTFFFRRLDDFTSSEHEVITLSE